MTDSRTIAALITEGTLAASAGPGSLVRRLTDALSWLAREHDDRDKGLDRWCDYHDRLFDTFDRLGLRERVFAELERDGWKNTPTCRHAAYRTQVEAAAKLAVGPTPDGELVVDAEALMGPEDGHHVRFWALVPLDDQPGYWVHPESGGVDTLSEHLRAIACVYLARAEEQSRG